MDVFLYVAILVLFATWATVHVCLCLIVGLRRPIWRGALALVVPPLAPFWGWPERKLAWTWLVVLTAYALALFAGSF